MYIRIVGAEHVFIAFGILLVVGVVHEGFYSTAKKKSHKKKTKNIGGDDESVVSVSQSVGRKSSVGKVGRHLKVSKLSTKHSNRSNSQLTQS